MWLQESNYGLKLVNQIFLFINVYTSVTWVATTCFVLYSNSSSDTDFFSLNFPCICFCIGLPVEVLRLFLGHSGNIKNNVLDLAGFLILTTFIEFPIHIYLLLSLYESLHRLTLAAQLVQIVLLPIEILINFVIIRSSLHERHLHFQMMYGDDKKFSQKKN